MGAVWLEGSNEANEGVYRNTELISLAAWEGSWESWAEPRHRMAADCLPSSQRCQAAGRGAGMRLKAEFPP